MHRRVGMLFIVASMVLAFSLTIQAKTTIKYQYNWYAITTPGYSEAFQLMVDTFNRSQDNIFVDGFVVQGGDQKLLTAIAGGVHADVVHFEASSVIEWVAQGLVEPIDDVFSVQDIRRDYYPAEAAEVVWNGRVWAIPGYANARGLFWNVDIFDEVGMDSSRAPVGITGLEELARKALKTDADGRIIRLGFAPWLGGFYPAGWFWSFGGEIYDPSTGLPTLENELNVRAWDWVQDWAQRYPPGQYSLTAQRASGFAGNFMDRSLAAVIAADNSVRTYTTVAPDLTFRTGEVPHAEGGRNGTWGGGVGHIIPRGTKYPKEAKEFMRWIATEGQWILYQQLNEFPPRRSLADRVVRSLDRNDLRLPLFTQMEMRNPRPPLWANVIRKLISAESAQVITGRVNPREVLANLQREVLPLYKALQSN
jgi:multiple sugar transport system substrate-binding protein